jgi:pimeloyl-ACP methyl ester carboxylesterase
VDDATARHLAGPLEGSPVTVGAVTLDVHVAGPADGEVVLLVAGLGMPRISWPPELVAQLHVAGYRTVAADNRDTGRSTVLPGGLAGLERTSDGSPCGGLLPHRPRRRPRRAPRPPRSPGSTWSGCRWAA